MWRYGDVPSLQRQCITVRYFATTRRRPRRRLSQRVGMIATQCITDSQSFVTIESTLMALTSSSEIIGFWIAVVFAQCCGRTIVVVVLLGMSGNAVMRWWWGHLNVAMSRYLNGSMSRWVDESSIAQLLTAMDTSLSSDSLSVVVSVTLSGSDGTSRRRCATSQVRIGRGVEQSWREQWNDEYELAPVMGWQLAPLLMNAGLAVVQL